MHRHITPNQLHEALTLTDLTDPTAGQHCMQLLVSECANALSAQSGATTMLHRGARVVSPAENYDLLGYPKDGPARDVRYTRYLSSGDLLRTQTSAAIPRALRLLAASAPENTLVVSPGLVYRRDLIDRLHVGEPHQMDLWRISKQPLAVGDLDDMIETVVRTLLPQAPWRMNATEHPYTLDGREVEVQVDGEWVELLECGLAHPHVLEDAGLTGYQGLAMGLGLDRAVMLRKGVTDIRLLRSTDPRVKRQMLDLKPYKQVSPQPAARRDLSVACAVGVADEEVGDRVRAALSPGQREWVEEVVVASRTPAAELPRRARERIGISDAQENLLLRVLLRHPTESLSKPAANALRDRIYAAVHEGSVHQWTTSLAR